MVIFILVIAAIMMISALAIKIFILFKYFEQKEKEVAITQDGAFTTYKNLNEKGIFSENQVEEIISQYKKSESTRKLNEEKEALLKLKDMKILSDEEYNEKMFILEDLYKCGKI